MEWIKANKLAACLLVVVLALAGIVWWQSGRTPETVVQTIEVPAQPQIVTQTVETVREVAVQAPSTQGAVLQIVERNGKVIARIGDQEVEVPNQTGQPAVKLGENGELKVTTEQVSKIDVTDMANAQGRLIAEKEVAKVRAEEKQKLDKEKSARRTERILWIGGIAAFEYLRNK